jgi:hypothetical protein
MQSFVLQFSILFWLHNFIKFSCKTGFQPSNTVFLQSMNSLPQPVHLEMISSCYLVSRPPLNPYGEIGSGYSTNVYDGNRLSLPILRQKLVLSGVWCLLTARWLLLWELKYLEYNSSIRTENTLNNPAEWIEQADRSDWYWTTDEQ